VRFEIVLNECTSLNGFALKALLFVPKRAPWDFCDQLQVRLEINSRVLSYECSSTMRSACVKASFKEACVSGIAESNSVAGERCLVCQAL
jgi:hypothetical protein